MEQARSTWSHGCEKARFEGSHWLQHVTTPVGEPCKHCGKSVEDFDENGDSRPKSFDWPFHIGTWQEHWQTLTTIEEFEQIRAKDPYEGQSSRMEHLVRHLERGELICRCDEDFERLIDALTEARKYYRPPHAQG